MTRPDERMASTGVWEVFGELPKDRTGVNWLTLTEELFQIVQACSVGISPVEDAGGQRLSLRIRKATQPCPSTSPLPGAS